MECDGALCTVGLTECMGITGATRLTVVPLCSIIMTPVTPMAPSTHMHMASTTITAIRGAVSAAGPGGGEGSGTTVMLEAIGRANEALLTVWASVTASTNLVGVMLSDAAVTELASVSETPLMVASKTIVVLRRCAADFTEQPVLY